MDPSKVKCIYSHPDDIDDFECQMKIITKTQFVSTMSIPTLVCKEIAEYSIGMLQDCETGQCSEKIVSIWQDQEDEEFENNVHYHHQHFNSFYCMDCYNSGLTPYEKCESCYWDCEYNICNGRCESEFQVDMYEQHIGNIQRNRCLDASENEIHILFDRYLLHWAIYSRKLLLNDYESWNQQLQTPYQFKFNGHQLTSMKTHGFLPKRVHWREGIKHWLTDKLKQLDKSKSKANV